MKKLLAICTLFLFFGCATMKPDDYISEGQESVTALNKSTGDTFAATDVAQLDANDAALQAELDTLNALIGLHFGVGDGTYTDMSAISSTELGLLDGKTAALLESGGDAGTPSAIDLTNGTNAPIIDQPYQLIWQTVEDDNYDGHGFTVSPGATITHIGVHCKGTCTTPATFTFADGAGNALTVAALTVATDAVSNGLMSFAAVSANGGFVDGERMEITVTNTPSPETDTYTLVFKQVIDHD